MKIVKGPWPGTTQKLWTQPVSQLPRSRFSNTPTVVVITNAYITESGDFYITETGSYYVTE